MMHKTWILDSQNSYLIENITNDNLTVPPYVHFLLPLDHWLTTAGIAWHIMVFWDFIINIWFDIKVG